ncbi:hypothetical protein QQP08_021475, partial [Theobroma cacao]
IEESPSSIVEDPQEEGGFDCHDFEPDFDSMQKTISVNASNIHCKEHKDNDGFNFFPAEGFGKSPIPPEGYVCHGIELTTGISKTCGSTSGSSFGGNIPPEVLNFAEHCARKKIVADDPLPNKTLRDAINRIVYHSGNPSSENSRTSFQVRDVASAASKDDPRKPLLGKEKYETLEARKTKITIPSQPTSEKVNEPTSKGSTLLAGKQEQKREKKEGL